MKAFAFRPAHATAARSVLGGRRTALLLLVLLAAVLLAACSKDDSTNEETCPVEADCLSLYDDFSGGTIDSVKWSLTQVSDGDDTMSVIAGELESHSEDNVGGGSVQRARVRAASESQIGAMAADVRITGYSPGAASAGARLMGFFYNSGTYTPGSFLNAVLSQIRLLGTDAHYNVHQCADAACTTFNTIIPDTTLGTVPLGNTATIFIGWDGGTTFTYQLNSDAPVVVDVGASLPNTGPPDLHIREVGTRLTGGSGAGEFITADFDNVRTGYRTP